MLKKRFFPVIFGLAFVALASLVVIAILIFNEWANDYRPLTISLGVMIIASVSLDGFLLTRYANKSILIKNLKYENEYNFGKQTEFYNMDMFSTTVTSAKLRKINTRREQYLMAFTGSNKYLMQNNDRNQTIIQLNGSIADMLSKMFASNIRNPRLSKDHLYAFDRGSFYIYCIGDNEHVIKSIIDDIKVNIAKIVEENNITIFIEPIFGVYKATSKTLVNEDVDNVDIARNVSESKFESVTYYSDTMRKVATMDQTKDLIDGLKNNEFVVYYQPKFNLASKQFTSSEALVRWNSPKYGLLFPSKFISIAESANLVHQIDTFVFKRVCEDLNETKRRGRRLLPVSVNFSLYEFFSSNFLDVILNMLDEYKIAPELIQIEITETTSQANQFLSVSIIKKLRERGIKILMDDFGVGFSNIGNFRKIPFDVIKIDKSFIDDIHKDHTAAEIVKFLIQLCKISNMEVVAEGVDNAEQVEILRKYKCDTIQGFYYSKALPKAEYDKFLVDNPFEKKEGRAR